MLFFPNGTTLWRKKCSHKIPKKIPAHVFYNLYKNLVYDIINMGPSMMLKIPEISVGSQMESSF